MTDGPFLSIFLPKVFRHNERDADLIAGGSTKPRLNPGSTPHLVSGPPQEHASICPSTGSAQGELFAALPGIRWPLAPCLTHFEDVDGKHGTSDA